MKLKALMAITGLTLFALVASGPSFARTKAQIDASADKAIAHFYRLNPKHKELADKAAGILIFGRVTKGGVGVAGEFGQGLLRVNGKTVDYYSVESASVGLGRPHARCRRAQRGYPVHDARLARQVHEEPGLVCRRGHVLRPRVEGWAANT